jgi:hypothetical protein
MAKLIEISIDEENKYTDTNSDMALPVIKRVEK